MAAIQAMGLHMMRTHATSHDTSACMHLPCPSYGPDEQVESVVELGAGQAEALGIKVGSPAVIERLQPRQP